MRERGWFNCWCTPDNLLQFVLPRPPQYDRNGINDKQQIYFEMNHGILRCYWINILLGSKNDRKMYFRDEIFQMVQ